MLSANREFLDEKLREDLTVTKVHELFERRVGEAVPYRTLHRFCAEELGHRSDKHTVRVADCDPGAELQVDFGKMGTIFDPESDRRRVLRALIFHRGLLATHVRVADAPPEPRRRHRWLRACEFFSGVFRVVVIDNIKAVVTKADAIDPRL